MSNISNLGDAYNWSVAKIAEAFGLNRGTVTEYQPGGVSSAFSNPIQHEPR